MLIYIYIYRHTVIYQHIRPIFGLCHGCIGQSGVIFWGNMYGWKMLLSFWDDLFSAAMLALGRVTKNKKIQETHSKEQISIQQQTI